MRALVQRLVMFLNENSNNFKFKIWAIVDKDVKGNRKSRRTCKQWVRHWLLVAKWQQDDETVIKVGRKKSSIN